MEVEVVALGVVEVAGLGDEEPPGVSVLPVL
jgi:hypothetical protein